jgi:hypothetical protein
MTRALGPSVGLGRDAAVPLAILGLCWMPVMAVGAVWLAGQAGSWISGNGWAGPEFGFDFAAALLDGGPAAAWPGTPPELIWALVGVLLLAVAAPVAMIVVRVASSRPAPGDPHSSLATVNDLEALAPAGAAVRALRLRPNLVPSDRRRLDPRDTGVELGQLRTGRRRSTSVRASWEDVVLAVMAPRAGKTTATPPGLSWLRATRPTSGRPPRACDSETPPSRCGCSTPNTSSGSSGAGGGTRCER